MRSAEPQITLPGAGVESPQITDPQITREPQIIREPQFTDEPQMAELSDRNLTSFAGKSGATYSPAPPATARLPVMRTTTMGSS